MIISWVFSPLRLIVISWFITARNSQCHTSLPVAQLCFVVAVRLFHAPNTFFSETKVVILSPFLCIVTGNRQPTALVPLSPLSNSAVEDVDICSDSFVFWFPPCPVTLLSFCIFSFFLRGVSLCLYCPINSFTLPRLNFCCSLLSDVVMTLKMTCSSGCASLHEAVCSADGGQQELGLSKCNDRV